MQYAFLILFSLGSTILCSQDFFDGFENLDISDWEILRGDATLVTDPVIEGNQSLRLGSDDVDIPESVVVHRSFDDDFGVYDYVARADGANSDIDFYFHFVDLDNYYVLSNKPAGTDNPEFTLSKVVQGQFTELIGLSPIVSAGEWTRTQVERTCNGQIIVRIGNVEVMSVQDNDLSESGTIGFRSWGQYSYVDSLSFTAEGEIFESPVPTMVQTCTGSGFAFGSMIYTTNGIYSDTISNISGCDSIVTIDLEFVDNVFVDTIIRICPGDSVQIGEMFYSTEGTSTEVLSTRAGCDSTINFEIEFSSTITSIVDTSICNGDTILVEDEVITASGSFDFSFLTNLGCDSIVTWNVSYTASSLDLGGTGFICIGETIILSAGNFDSYIWNDQSTESELEITLPGMYSVTVVDDDGCLFMDSIIITEQCELVVLGANVFSPNGDGVNDTWLPTLSRTPEDYSLRVYDRWGSLLFTTSDFTESWNGESNGSPLSTGVYIWQVIADGQTQISDVTLIR